MNLLCPPLDLIYEDPKTLEDFSSDRHISHDTFLTIVNFLTSSDSRLLRLEDLKDLKNKVTDELFIIQYLTKYQLALFSYHIIKLNEDQLEDYLVENLYSKLKQIYLPPWEQNYVAIDQGIREILLTEIPFKLPENKKKAIENIIESIGDNIPDTIREDLDIAIEFNYWPVSILLNFVKITNLYYDSNNTSEEEDLDTILQIFEEPIVELMIKNQDSWLKKSSVAFILFKWFMDKGDEGLNSAQELLDELWSQWEERKTEDLEIFRFLFLTANSILVKYLYKTSISFISKRNLIHSLISKLEVDTNNYWNILNLVFNQDEMHPWVLRFLLEGFSSYIEVVFDLLKSLPSSDEKSRLVDHLIIQIKQFLNLVLDYLASNYQIVHPEEDATTFVDQIQVHAKHHQFDTEFFDFVDTCISKYLFLDHEKSILSQNQVFYLDLWLKLIQTTDQEPLLFLYELDMLMLTGQYPFGPIYEMIKKEVEYTNSVMESDTFEERIVVVITQALDYLANTKEDTKKLDFRAYEILLYFTTEWLHHFSKEKELFAETSSILSAIIIISYSNLTREYFKNKEIEKAFLMYLNMYYFSEYVNTVIYSFPEFEIENQSSVQHLSAKFKEMVLEWDFHNLINREVFDSYAANVELSLKNSLPDQINIQSSMLDDDLLFKFLDIKDTLDQFFNQDIQTINGSQVKKIGELEIYEHGEQRDLTRLGRIGSTVENEEEQPFPLFKKVELFSATMSLIPIEVGTENLSQEAIISSIENLWNRK